MHDGKNIFPVRTPLEYHSRIVLKHPKMEKKQAFEWPDKFQIPFLFLFFWAKGSVLRSDVVKVRWPHPLDHRFVRVKERIYSVRFFSLFHFPFCHWPYFFSCNSKLNFLFGRLFLTVSFFFFPLTRARD